MLMLNLLLIYQFGAEALLIKSYLKGLHLFQYFHFADKIMLLLSMMHLLH